MGLELNGWDMDDVSKQMRGKTLFEVLALYKEKEKQYLDKADEFVQAIQDKNEAAKERIEKEANHIEKEKCVIAIHIADSLSIESKSSTHWP